MPIVRHMEATAEDVKSRWGRLLQQKREENGETQVQFAARLRRDPQTISRLERGSGSMDSFLAAGAALGIDLLREES